MAFLAVSALVLLSGCASLTIHSTVEADGTISEYQMNITTSREVYGFLEQSAEDEGYENVSESILSDIDESKAESVSYEETFAEDSVTMSITMEGFEPGNDSDISITTEDGTMTYVDETFFNESYDPDSSESEMGEAMGATLSVDYYLTMPGEITDSNADSVDGNTAEWHESGPESMEDNRIYAESEIPTTSSLPGFGPIVAILALIGGGILLSRNAI